MDGIYKPVRFEVVVWWAAWSNRILIFMGCFTAFMQSWVSATSHIPTSASILLSVLGGPIVTYGPLGLVEEKGWTWLLVVGVFAVAAGMADELGNSNWAALEVARCQNYHRWIFGKLVASGITSLAYICLLTMSFYIAMIVGGIKLVVNGEDMVCLVMACIMFISIGWTKVWIQTTRYRKFASLAVLLLLADAAFGGRLAPAIPFAQAIYGLHDLPGTMTRLLGGAYLCGSAVLTGGMAIWQSTRHGVEVDLRSAS